SILSGQLYQAKEAWEVLCFEYLGKRAFDSLVLLIQCVVEMGTETEYAPCGTEPIGVDFVAPTAEAPDAAAEPDAETSDQSGINAAA
ncbi:MAG: hypothetical protein K0U34_02920, partial [Alphaproteobacteria bacterium]|nr:hypothetical protein [Alphaproteobacteria bacterium]